MTSGTATKNVRDRLIDAAEVCLRAKGIRSTTVSEVAHFPWYLAKRRSGPTESRGRTAHGVPTIAFVPSAAVSPLNAKQVTRPLPSTSA